MPIDEAEKLVGTRVVRSKGRHEGSKRSTTVGVVDSQGLQGHRKPRLEYQGSPPDLDPHWRSPRNKSPLFCSIGGGRFGVKAVM